MKKTALIFLVSILAAWYLFALDSPYVIKDPGKEPDRINENFRESSRASRKLEEKILRESSGCATDTPKREGVFCYDTEENRVYVATSATVFAPIAFFGPAGLAAGSTEYIQNRNTLQAGATAYPDSVTANTMNVGGIFDADQTRVLATTFTATRGHVDEFLAVGGAFTRERLHILSTGTLV